MSYPGTHGQALSKWASALDTLDRACRALGDLGSAQIQYALLRHCLDACRINHLLRSCDTLHLPTQVDAASSTLRQAMEDIAGVGFSDHQWAQCCLPLRLGGLGLKCPVLRRAGARVAAYIYFRSHAPSAVGTPLQAIVHLPTDLNPLLSELQVQLGPVFEPVAGWIAQPASLSQATDDHTSQKWWAEKVEEEALPRLVQQGSLRDRGRLSLQKHGFGSAWLAVHPSRAMHTLLPSTSFRLLLKWWLGIPLAPTSMAGASCPNCHSPCDPFGDHFVCCHLNHLTNRHTAVQDAREEGFPVCGSNLWPRRATTGLQTSCCCTGREGGMPPWI